MVNADPARTPTFALFARPDHYLYDGGTTCGPCVQVVNTDGWNHGDYAAEINTNWVGFVGPGVKHLGLDGSAPARGPNSAGANSGQTTVVQSHTKGTWVDETDIRPTILYLTGLHDDYLQDGRVISQILTHTNGALRGRAVTALGTCYKQLDSSVGQFGAFTLIASTKAVRSRSPGDSVFNSVNAKLFALEKARDSLAGQIKDELNDAAFWNVELRDPQGQLRQCQALIGKAAQLASSA